MSKRSIFETKFQTESPFSKHIANHRAYLRLSSKKIERTPWFAMSDVSLIFISCVSPGTDDCFVENRLFVIPYSIANYTKLECIQLCKSLYLCKVSYELLYHFKITISRYVSKLTSGEILNLNFGGHNR